jgi:hypothetical protein
MNITTINETTIQCGPLTWKRKDNAGHECWDCEPPAGLSLSYFCVKRYSAKPEMHKVDMTFYGGTFREEENAFSGWRLVSGGPFTSVGGWSSRDDAIKAATPWLVNYWTAEVAELRARATRIERSLAEFAGKLEAA